MDKIFEIGEEVDILIDDEVLKFKCNSTHTEKLETNNKVSEHIYFGFNSDTGMHMSLSWENKLQESKND